MKSIGFYCDADAIEQNAMQQLQQYAQKPYIEAISAFTDIHYCQEKALPVGVAFQTSDHMYPLITGKDIGCGVMYLKTEKTWWQKPFDKSKHYAAWQHAYQKMTDDGLGGGNHFLSIEEDDMAVYIICHTGTRDRGIALAQEGLQLTKDYSAAIGQQVDHVHRDFIPQNYLHRYLDTLHYGYQRRMDFCIKTLIFLQNANYIRCNKAGIDRNYLQNRYNTLPQGEINGTPYFLEDSIHNHIRIEQDKIVHRKGSTELLPDRTAVIPLSMSRGSILVQPLKTSRAAFPIQTRQTQASSELAKALFSCAHGAGRRLSRFDAMKHWKTVLKEKERKAYKQRFSELLGRNGEFPSGYIQEFDFAYKDATDIFLHQPYLKKVTQTTPVVTIKHEQSA